MSLTRTDDIVRGTYHIRMDVDQAQPFSRFAIFQIGADTYNFTREAKFAIGDVRGLRKEWATQPGGDRYKTEPVEMTGSHRWVSMHQASPRPGSDGEHGAWANRGLVVRGWGARLGGKEAPPFVAERGTTRHRSDYSTIDIVPPPGVTELVPGDFVEAVFEYLVIPQNAADYYGPNAGLRAALQAHGNTWQMVHRESAGNARALVNDAQLIRRFPDIRVHTDNDIANLTVNRGLGFVPITITGLTSHDGYTLNVDGKPFDQSVHGNDFWQTDFDPATRRWSRTYNVKLPSDKACQVELTKSP